MAIPPQAAMNAPSGPRNPQMRTEAARSGDAAANVVCRMRKPQLMPARMPHRWIARCAGVQKVSRPIDWCQEMSHSTPTMAEVTAATEHHTYQGSGEAGAAAIE